MDDPSGSAEDLWRILQTVSEWSRVADAKAGAILAVDGVILAVLAGGPRGSQGPGFWTTLVLLCAVTLAVLSGVLAVWALVPKSKKLRLESIAHYRTIAGHKLAEDYRRAAFGVLADSNEFVEDLTRHIWTLSRAVTRNGVLVTWAIGFLVGAMVVGTLTLFTR